MYDTIRCHIFAGLCNINPTTAEAVAAPIIKWDRVAKLQYITRSVQSVKDVNFEVP